MAVEIARAARWCGSRPSTLLQVRDPREALDLDLALITRTRQERLAAITEEAGEDVFKLIVLLLMELL